MTTKDVCGHGVLASLKALIRLIRKGVTAYRSARSKQQACAALVPILVVVAATGCGKPDYPAVQPPSLQSTISSDGKMVVTLDRTDRISPRLTVFRLENGIEVDELPAPPHTTRIRFGLSGYELLLTHFIGDRHVADLLKWDLAEPSHPPEHIYRSIGTDYPLEVEPGLFMLKDCVSNKDEPGQCLQRGNRWWRLVTRNGLMDSFRNPSGITLYGWPNVVTGKGFFWINERAHRTSPRSPPAEFPLFLKLTYPDGSGPDTSHLESLGDETRGFACDYEARRCLRVFIANWWQKGPKSYVYDVDVVFDGTQCPIEWGGQGYIAGRSMTPDGRAAVLTVADSYAAPRRVVVLRFDEGQCAPIEVQTIFQGSE